MRCRCSPLRSGLAAAVGPNYSPNPAALRPLVRVRPQPGRAAHNGIAAVVRDCKHSHLRYHAGRQRSPELFSTPTGSGTTGCDQSRSVNPVIARLHRTTAGAAL